MMQEHSGTAEENEKDRNGKLDTIIRKYQDAKEASQTSGTGLQVSSYRPPPTGYHPGNVRSDSFDAQNLQRVVDEIKVIEGASVDTNVAIFAQRALAQIRLKEYSAAEQSMAAADALSPDHAETLAARANLAFVQG